MRPAETWKAAGLALRDWFLQNGRDLPWRHTRDPYRIWISEIMLQQTRVEKVIGYYEKFLEMFPTLEDLAAADRDTVFKCWEGLGYYRRAENLILGARYIQKEHNGAFPGSVDVLKKIPGIGDYTAGAIAAVAFGKREAAVDGNVLRVVSRLAGIRDMIGTSALANAAKEVTLDMMPADAAWSHTQAMMDLGATVCLPTRPLCGVCPLKEYCVAWENGEESELPVKRSKKTKKEVQRKIYLLFCDGKILMRRRPESGLLRGMWEFPADEDENSFLEQFQTGELHETISSVHVFSHVVWNMKGYWTTVEETIVPERCQWMDPDQLKTIPLPSALSVFRQDALEKMNCLSQSVSLTGKKEPSAETDP